MDRRLFYSFSYCGVCCHCSCKEIFFGYHLAIKQAKIVNLASRIDKLWRDVDFNWYRNGKNALYWHWSPNFKWEMNFPVQGYNECLIMYVLAASSPTHGVPAEVYHEGWAQSGKINENPPAYAGYKLQLHHQGDATNGGPLFWAHYSYLGLDPRGLKDQYADYWEENKNQSLINYQWCVTNPNKFKGYGPDSWGLTSSYSIRGYAGHAPSEKRDLGVISPTAALSGPTISSINIRIVPLSSTPIVICIPIVQGRAPVTIGGHRLMV